MADKATLIALNAELMGKLKAGTASDDDVKTLKAVMKLLEELAVCKPTSFGHVHEPVTQAKRRVQIAPFVVQARYSATWSSGQEWYGRATIERMRIEAEGEPILSEGNHSLLPTISKQRDVPHADDGRQRRIQQDHEAAERIAAAERALAARQREHMAAEQREREERRRREEEAQKKAAEAEARRKAAAAQQRREQEEARIKAAEAEARRQAAAEQRRREEAAAEQRRRAMVEDAKRKAAEAAERSPHRETPTRSHALLLPGGYAIGDRVESLIDFVRDGVNVLKYDRGVVAGACDGDVPGKHDMVRVDYGRRGMLNVRVRPDAVAAIRRVVLPSDAPKIAPSANHGPQPMVIDDPPGASVRKLSFCDRCGERFHTLSALEKHRSDRISNAQNSVCAMNCRHQHHS